jgi:hypothetical protein
VTASSLSTPPPPPPPRAAGIGARCRAERSTVEHGRGEEAERRQVSQAQLRTIRPILPLMTAEHVVHCETPEARWRLPLDRQLPATVIGIHFYGSASSRSCGLLPVG